MYNRQAYNTISYNELPAGRVVSTRTTPIFLDTSSSQISLRSDQDKTVISQG